MHARSHSETSIASSSSSSGSCSRPQPRIAVVGRGREALALSPNTAEEFRHNLSLAVCSSPELTIPTTYPAPNPNPGPVLRRIASEAPYKPSRASRLPPLSSSASRAKGLALASKGLPPPPRPRRRPPPVFVTTLGAPLALAEQSFSPFVAPDVTSPVKPRRSASVPPSAVSSSFWGCAGGDGDYDEELDLDGLDAVYDDYEFSETEVEEEEGQGVKSPLGGLYFAPNVEGGVYSSPPSSPRKAKRSASPPLEPRRQLRVMVSTQSITFRDSDTRKVAAHQSYDDAEMIGQNMLNLPSLEDGIKTRQHLPVEQEAVYALGGQRATKVSIGKALGRWLKRHT